MKLSSLTEKENEIKKELASAIDSVGEAFDEANKENAAERDKKREQLLEEYKMAAAKRHRVALMQLNKAKEHQRVEENKIIELRKSTRSQENCRSKRVLEKPLEHSQPLIQVPSTRPSAKPALGGLDAFTKTYYHLPVSGIGVVDEKSLRGGGTKDAKTLAAEVEAMMQDCWAKLAESKQAREERADVRGSAALQKVQLRNVLEDVTSQLDKVAVFNRTRKQPYGIKSNVFASNSARENTQKQQQVELEHAVEDIFDRNFNVEMVLPSSVKFEDVEDSVVSFAETSADTVGNETSELQPLAELSESKQVLQTNTEHKDLPKVQSPTTSDVHGSDDLRGGDDMRGEESRPSLSLYFPLHSDISSELDRGETIVEAADVVGAYSGQEAGDDKVDLVQNVGARGSVVVLGEDGDADDEGNGGETTRDTLQETLQETQHATWDPITPMMESSRVSSDASSASKQSIGNTSTSSLNAAIPTAGSKARNTDLSALIEEQLKINSELRLLAKPLNTSVEESDMSLNQPPPISFTKPLPKTSASSTPSTTMSFQEIVQELLSSSQASSSKSTEVTRASDSMSQHTLSQNSSVNSSKTVTKLERKSCSDMEQSVGELSCASSKNSNGSVQQSRAGSVASDLSVLQNQLKRINSHLSEIGKIKDQDNLFYRF